MADLDGGRRIPANGEIPDDPALAAATHASEQMADYPPTAAPAASTADPESEGVADDSAPPGEGAGQSGGGASLPTTNAENVEDLLRPAFVKVREKWKADPENEGKGEPYAVVLDYDSQGYPINEGGTVFATKEELDAYLANEDRPQTVGYSAINIRDGQQNDAVILSEGIQQEQDAMAMIAEGNSPAAVEEFNRIEREKAEKEGKGFWSRLGDKMKEMGASDIFSIAIAAMITFQEMQEEQNEVYAHESANVRNDIMANGKEGVLEDYETEKASLEDYASIEDQKVGAEQTEKFLERAEQVRDEETGFFADIKSFFSPADEKAIKDIGAAMKDDGVAYYINEEGIVKKVNSKDIDTNDIDSNDFSKAEQLGKDLTGKITVVAPVDEEQAMNMQFEQQIAKTMHQNQSQARDR